MVAAETLGTGARENFKPVAFADFDTLEGKLRQVADQNATTGSPLARERLFAPVTASDLLDAMDGEVGRKTLEQLAAPAHAEE